MTETPKVSQAAYCHWIGFEWYKVKGTMRFGQAFLNRFLPSTVDPDLFYEEDTAAAIEIIRERYLRETILEDWTKFYLDNAEDSV